MLKAERMLVLVLRLAGVITGLAVLAVFMPRAWMGTIHGWLGLGAIPSDPVFEYMARSLSALYAIHGGLCLMLSRDVARYRPIIAYVAWAGLVFGALVFGVDMLIGMPRAWAWGEGTSVVALSAAVLVLLGRTGRVAGPSPQDAAAQPSHSR